MELFLWILGAALIDALLGFAGIFSFYLRDDMVKKLAFYLTAFAGGALIGGAFFHLLPEASEFFEPLQMSLLIVGGFTAFLAIEGYFHWHHCEDCEIHPFTYTMIVGDAIHNTIDGLVMAAAFIASIPLGIATALVIIGHEFPQQLGIFGVLFHGGFTKQKALIYSFLAQSTVIIGALLGFFLAASSEQFASMLLPIAAGGFIYIAGADLIPEVHKSRGAAKVLTFFTFILGLAFMLWIKLTFGG
ncbi:MAG: ZIP family metal transporter [Candidatus ainarchaeum sp.]|nr:ZIP family metal transporter [Candidatus ainarchaeum sp.]MDD5096460.1 ZIP family metal transporter [Candidatus ainarchaeum sp.]